MLDSEVTFCLDLFSDQAAWFWAQAGKENKTAAAFITRGAATPMQQGGRQTRPDCWSADVPRWTLDLKQDDRLLGNTPFLFFAV